MVSMPGKSSGCSWRYTTVDSGTPREISTGSSVEFFGLANVEARKGKRYAMLIKTVASNMATDQQLQSFISRFVPEGPREVFKLMIEQVMDNAVVSVILAVYPREGMNISEAERDLVFTDARMFLQHYVSLHEELSKFVHNLGDGHGNG